MQCKQGNEKVDMIITSNISASRPISVKEDPDIQQTRQTLLIILGICLALSVISVISNTLVNEISNGMQKNQGGIRVGSSLIWLLFHGFGIFVAYHYSETGLKVIIRCHFH
ncbi:unnamed protein product [Rotaria sordida]|uniref:Uncharacterized protein n=1 Tax=Rotaria sordida TaxID=392033 RepID=A0A819TKN5_9BILA|nr:unnamed protein product [Rotaria sordida]CAF4066646.1 unnamed protein product [Rotaria sordida]